METLKEYYYTYYSYEEWGRGYFGSRKCYCLPEEDIKYFGSSKDKNFKPTQKIILKDDYSTREEAYADEIILQEYYKVVENPHFANRAYQTSTGFSTYGKKHTEEYKNKLSEYWKGEKNPNYNAGKNHSFFGKKHTEEWKLNQSNKMKNNNPMKNPEVSIKQSQSMKGKLPWNKGITDLGITGEKNPRAKKIIFNGETFGCIKDAIKKTGVSRHIIKKSCIFID
jgi:hypothetical protein